MDLLKALISLFIETKKAVNYLLDEYRCSTNKRLRDGYGWLANQSWNVGADDGWSIGAAESLLAESWIASRKTATLRERKSGGYWCRVQGKKTVLYVESADVASVFDESTNEDQAPASLNGGIGALGG